MDDAIYWQLPEEDVHAGGGGGDGGNGQYNVAMSGTNSQQRPSGKNQAVAVSSYTYFNESCVRDDETSHAM
jgi:hypothetical protein